MNVEETVVEFTVTEDPEVVLMSFNVVGWAESDPVWMAEKSDYLKVEDFADQIDTEIEENEAVAAATEHISNLNNPHSTTKSQVGLSDVDNTSDLNKPISNLTQTALDGKSDIGHTHIIDDIDDLEEALGGKVDKTITVNGHALSSNVSVTKSDIGLGNVDNTADLSKPISTLTQTALNAKQNSLGFTPENVANKNAVSGYAGLDEAGLIPSSLLPGFVDDVLEYSDLSSFPISGSTGKLYIALDSNKTYRWSGSTYVEISASPGSTDSVTEGSVNLYFTASRVLSTVSTGLSLLTGGVISATDTILVALGKLQKQITDNLSTLTSHIANTSNPHSVTKSQVGLSLVDNTADSSKSVASAAALTTARNIDGQSFDGTGNITVIAPGTHAATSKATPVDADELPIVDTAASNVLKKLTWANLKATLKTYFDTLYVGLPSYGNFYMDTLNSGSGPVGTALTTITGTQDTYVELFGVTIAGANLNNFTVTPGTTSVPGSITYTGAVTKLFEVEWTYSASTNESTMWYKFGLTKNGTRDASAGSSRNKGSANVFSGGGNGIMSLAQGDVIKIACAPSTTTAGQVRLFDCTIKIKQLS